jgi:hypothetical protein
MITSFRRKEKMKSFKQLLCGLAMCGLGGYAISTGHVVFGTLLALAGLIVAGEAMP